MISHLTPAPPFGVLVLVSIKVPGNELCKVAVSRDTKRPYIAEEGEGDMLVIIKPFSFL